MIYLSSRIAIDLLFIIEQPVDSPIRASYGITRTPTELIPRILRSNAAERVNAHLPRSRFL